jgi:putative ABC transport system permease protein
MLVRGAMTTAVARTTATMAPVLATVAFATPVLGYVDTGRSAYGGAELPGGTTAVVGALDTPGLGADTVAQVRQLAPEVRPSLPTTVWIGAGSLPTAAEALGDDSLPAGTAKAAAAVARPGSVLPLVLADGTRVRLRVTGATPDGSAVTVPGALVRAHDAVALTKDLAVRGSSRDQLAAAIRPGVAAFSPIGYLDAVDESEWALLRIFVLVILSLALGYTLLAVANTLLMATAGRVRDLALLRLAGGSPGQVLLAVAGESVVTVLLGAVLGLGAGVAGMLGVCGGLARELDRHVALQLPWDALALVVGACAALALVASLWPAWRVVRRSPVR